MYCTLNELLCVVARQMIQIFYIQIPIIDYTLHIADLLSTNKKPKEKKMKYIPIVFIIYIDMNQRTACTSVCACRTMR